MHSEQIKEWCPRYRMPVLKTSEKGWRVEFYYNKNGCFTRKQIRVEKYRKQFPNNDNARMWIQENIMYPLSEELRKGWTPEQGLPRLAAGTITLKKLLDEFGNDKRQKFGADILRSKSIGTYKTISLLRNNPCLLNVVALLPTAIFPKSQHNKPNAI